MTDVRVIGAGLAGCEASLQLARFGFQVELFEMKPKKKTPAQKLDGICELVCSNSFRSNKSTNAVGLIKDEMLILNGALIDIAFTARVPAGDCLAVDRVIFSKLVEERIRAQKNISLVSQEVVALPLDDTLTIMATGPLTSDALAADLTRFIGEDRFYFYDAIAPIIDAQSIDMSQAFIQSRWSEDGGDYINCPLDRETYERFVDRLNNSQRSVAHNFEEEKYFEGCLPIEVLASRGLDTLRFGPMKPVGLLDPHKNEQPYAVLQLRKEDKYGVSYNLVGCQTRMTIGEQKETFSLIPALKKANFMRFGSIHRNSYVNAPMILDESLRIKNRDGSPTNIFLAGQITGVEGYVESMATGLFLSHVVKAIILGEQVPVPPAESAMGGLYRHVLGQHRRSEQDPYVPSNITWAMIPPLNKANKRMSRSDKRARLYDRAIAATKEYAKLLFNTSDQALDPIVESMCP